MLVASMPSVVRRSRTCVAEAEGPSSSRRRPVHVIGNVGRPTHAYAASKGALLSLTRAMAATYGPENIRVNALLPGFIETRLTADVSSNPEHRRAAVDSIALRRTGRPDEMATCALFLASDDASFVTGAMLVADGGQTIL
jgi:NAD(P)-dependent dehydrogenase (short-subunit alcohol dehydrogenase family)